MPKHPLYKNRKDSEQQFHEIGKRLEKWLLRAGLLLAALLVLFQCLLHFPSVRSSLIRVDSLEGARYPYDASSFNK